MRLAERQFLVKPSWLRSHLRDRGVVIMDTDPLEAYLRSHIPRAIHLDLHDYFVLDTRPSGIAKMEQGLTRAFSNADLSGEEAVVLYETGLGIRAPRMAWMLEFLGHPDVRMLDGGFAAWRKARLPLAEKPSTRRPAKLRVEVRPELLAVADDLHARLQSSDRVVLDVRSRGEYTGGEMRECCARAGRIPGAVWVEWSTLLKDQRHYRKPSEIEAILRRLGVTKDKEVVTYCHRGARAANTFYALRLLGYDRVRNYVGSWHEWSMRADLPAERD